MRYPLAKTAEWEQSLCELNKGFQFEIPRRLPVKSGTWRRPEEITAEILWNNEDASLNKSVDNNKNKQTTVLHLCIMKWGCHYIPK